jgi:hypothetical protein
MRELRAVDRLLDRHHATWSGWSPGTAQFALQELRAVTEFVDTLRARTLEPAGAKATRHRVELAPAGTFRPT